MNKQQPNNTVQNRGRREGGRAAAPHPAAPRTGQTHTPAKRPAGQQPKKRPASAVPAKHKVSAPEKPAVKSKDIIRDDDIIQLRGAIDRPLMVIIFLLLCIGAVMVFSASYAYAYNKTGNSFYFIWRHLVFIAIGIAAALGISFLKIDTIRFWTPAGYTVAFGLLILVLVIGVAEGDAQRWIRVPFFGTFQPSELMKLMLVLMLAWYYAKYENKVMRFKNEKNGMRKHDLVLFWHSSFWGVFFPLGIVASVCVMIMLESHLSGTVIMFLIGAVVVFISGAIKLWLVGGGGIGLGIVFIMINTVPYMKKRFDMFMHPELFDTTNDTWQTTQGLIAVGSGGFLGVGLGESRQKHMFVSQPQNDFIFSIVCEELGFVGAALILCIFAAFVWRSVVIAMRAQDTFCRISALGIAFHIAIQTLLNVAVVTNMIPNTGISLPFFSYGGSSMLCLMIEMGVLLCISRYCYQQK
ncbi:MAG: cell division protein FtsW [Clostridia bacterium]|nr:cell division protein FtsW [Clostridia bacterium]